MTKYKYLFFIFLLGAASCEDKAPFLASDLGRVSDATAVSCEPFSGENHDCLILTQPWNQFVRVYDLSKKSFIAAPAGVFSLAVKVGTFSNFARSHASSPFSYILDSIDGKIYAISNKFIGSTPSFLSPKFIDTYQNASDLLLFSDDHQRLIALIAVPEKKLLARIVIDPTTGERDSSVILADIPLDFEPQMLALSVDQSKVVISSSSGTKIGILAGESVHSWDVKAPTLRVATGQMDLGKGVENFAVLLRLDKAEAIVISLDNPNVVSNIKLAELAVHLYVPSGNVPSCCGGVDKWAMIVSIFSKLSYVNLANLRNISPDEANAASRVTSIDMASSEYLGERATRPSSIVPGIGNFSDQLFITFDARTVVKVKAGTTEVKPLDAD